MIEISEQLAQELQGEMYADNSYFNPIEIDGKWYISEEEVILNQNDKYEFELK